MPYDVFSMLMMSSIIGLCVGSFINVVVWRLPRGESVVYPRSYCPHCLANIKLIDNIPILSWLLLKRKCRLCKVRISSKYPLIELISCILFLSCNFVVKSNDFDSFGLFAILPSWILVSCLLSLSLIDIYHFWIPDKICKFTIILGFLLTAINGLITYRPIPLIIEHFIAIVIGYYTFELLRYIAKLIYKKEAIGHGDSKLAALLGAWLGLKGLGLALLLSFTISGIYVAIGLTFGLLQRRQNIAFVPFLSLGCYLVWALGNQFWIDSLFPSIN